MGDVGLSGHVLCDGQETVLFLGNDLKRLLDIALDDFIDLAYLRLALLGWGLGGTQQFNQLDDDPSVNLPLLSVDALLLACQIYGREHDQCSGIGNLILVLTEQELLGRGDDLLLDALLLALGVHSQVRQCAQRQVVDHGVVELAVQALGLGELFESLGEAGAQTALDAVVVD